MIIEYSSIMIIIIYAMIIIYNATMKLKDTSYLEKNCDKPRQQNKKQRHHFAEKSPYSQRYGFFSSYV